MYTAGEQNHLPPALFFGRGHCSRKVYLSAGVPLALSTDDEGISRIDLSHEYQRAVESYNLDYEQLKRLFRNVSENIKKDVCLNYGAQCKDFLSTQFKARLQWELENRFLEFENIR